MKSMHMRRWIATGMTGALFALVAALGAGPVAADGNGAGQPLVQPYPGQDPQSPIQVVSSPGFVQTGTQANPITGQVNVGNGVQVPINGGFVGTGVPYYPGNVYAGVPYYPGYVYPNGTYYNPGYINQNGGTFGYTQAGPIIGYDGNGAALVYDVRGGTVDRYVTGPDGKYCEANSAGQCQP